MEILVIDNVKYYSCVEMARKLNMKNGMELVRQHKDGIIKKYNKYWIKASLIDKKPIEVKFEFTCIKPFSTNKMNKAVTRDGQATLVNTKEYIEFRESINEQVYYAFKENRNLLKGLQLHKPLVMEIEAKYKSIIGSNGTRYVMDCSNVIKPIEDVLFEAISRITKVKSFDDKSNIEVRCKIVDVKKSTEEGYTIKLRNSKNYSQYTEELRCGEIRREIALR